MDCLALVYIAMLRLEDGARAYSGTKAVESSATDEVSDAEIVAPPESTPARPNDSRPTTPPSRIDDADRWRFAFTLHAFGFAAIGDTIGFGGVGAGGYFGVGVPRRSRARYTRSGFGVASDVTRSVPRAITHRHRVATSGLVWRDTSLTRRYLSLYYLAGVGAAVHGRGVGGSIGGRIGVASSRDLHYIASLGVDLDLVKQPQGGDSTFALLFSLSVLTFGML